MNLIEESFQTKEEKNSGTAIKVVLAAIVLVVIAIIGIIVYMQYLEANELKVNVDGIASEDVKKMLIFEGETVYVPIKRVAKYLGYNSFNGDYFEKSESNKKCYVESDREVANFELNSNKIYKLDKDAKAESYNYVYSEKPVKSINGELCATSETIEKAFNVRFTYNSGKKLVQIFTLPYLVEFYNTYVLGWGYDGISESLANQKAILQNMIVVTQNKKFGVIDTDDNKILEIKYGKIEYLPTINGGKDFLVSNNGKIGVISNDKKTKIPLDYDSIQLLDLDLELYVVGKEGKYGVLDQNGKTIIYIENEDIGIDISKFEKNEIKSQYILAENLIPVKNDGKWGLYNIKGEQLVDFEYDSLGYITSNGKGILNLLVIPEYNVIVACKNKKYTLLNNIGEQLINGAVADAIYMEIKQGEKEYSIMANDQTISATAYLDQFDEKMTKNTDTQSNNKNNRDEQEDSNNEDNEVTNSQENENYQEQNGDDQNGDNQNNDEQENEQSDNQE